MPAFFHNYKKIEMGELVIYIDPQKAQELDKIIAKQTPTINIDLQKAHNLDWHLVLQKLY